MSEAAIELEVRVPCFRSGCSGWSRIQCLDLDGVRTWRGICFRCKEMTVEYESFGEAIREWLGTRADGMVFIAAEEPFEKKLEGMQFFLKYWEGRDILTFSLVFRWRHSMNGIPEKKLRTEIRDNVRLRNLLVGIVMEEEI